VEALHQGMCTRERRIVAKHTLERVALFLVQVLRWT
jgi:hypothetical protein